jgi:hypothetical protein
MERARREFVPRAAGKYFKSGSNSRILLKTRGHERNIVGDRSNK